MQPPTQTELNRLALILVANQQALTIHDARTLYLFGPGRFKFHDDIHHVRSSLDAALRDVRGVVDRDSDGRVRDPDRSRSWIGASGYLMLLDQLGTVFDFGSFTRLLTSDLGGGLSEDEAAAIYGLRNAFIHNYGLVNEPPANRSEAYRTRLRHVFNLQVGGNQLVVVGDRTNVLTRTLRDVPATVVDLGRLGDLVEMIVAEIRARHMRGEALPWRIDDVDRFVGLWFFHHQDPMEMGT